MKKIAFAIAIMAALFTVSGTAEAQRSRPVAAGMASAGMDWESGNFRSEQYPQSRSAGESRSERSTRRGRSTASPRVASPRFASLTGGSGVGPRPGKWCGWWMRTQLGGGPAYNLAWNWRNYGSSTQAQVGAVVVWRHHVGMITGQASNGQWIVKSGNDGGRVRERARSVSGAIFRI